MQEKVCVYAGACVCMCVCVCVCVCVYVGVRVDKSKYEMWDALLLARTLPKYSFNCQKGGV